MADAKKYTKAWLKEIVANADADNRSAYEVLCDLLNDLKAYTNHLDEIDANRGKGMSPAKYAALVANGRKGGWPKGRPRKPRDWQQGTNDKQP